MRRAGKRSTARSRSSALDSVSTLPFDQPTSTKHVARAIPLRVIVVIVALILSAVVVLNLPILLRSAGEALVTADPVEPADVIVIAVDAFEDGALEAADLVERGIATRVALFTAQDTALQKELRRRHVPVVTPIDRVIETLKSLGVSDIERIEPLVSGTTDSIPVLVKWAHAHQITTIMLVTTADHSRRLYHVVGRTASGGIRVSVHPTPYSDFTADRWWKNRIGVRRFVAEVPKLAVDIALHPASYVF